MTSSYTPIAIQHVNLAIPKGTLEQAQEFYGDVIGFKNDQVPQLQRGTILWFRVGDGPQQIHVSFEKGSTETGPALSDPSPISSRHPCFSLPSQEALTALQERIYEHHIKGVPASAQECDKPGGENSGSKEIIKIYIEMHCTIKFAISKGNYAWSIGSLRLKVAKPVSAQNCTICTRHQ